MAKDNKTLNISDDLNLESISYPNIPSEIVFPDELNRFLRDQIQYLVHENGMLKKNLSENESNYIRSQTEIREFASKLKNYESLCNQNELLTSPHVASTKIVELSKKLREKNSIVETLKTKCSKLEQHMFEMKKQSESCNEISEKEKSIEPPIPDVDELKKLQCQNSSLKSKLFETKNLNLQLNNDLKQANKWLQQEIGENFESLTALNSSKSNWRGRSQIICDLQQKNNELKEKLRVFQEKVNSTTVTNTSENKAESRVSILEKENNQLKTNFEDLKKKFDSLKARNKAIDADYAHLKSKFDMMVQQSEKDENMITTLSTQISNYTESTKFTMKQNEKLTKKLRTENETLNGKIKQLQCMVGNLSKEIQEKKSATGDATNKNQEDKSVSCLEAEKLKLLELLDVQNKRIETERNSHSQTQCQLRYEKQRAAKLEGSLARMEVEQNSSRFGSYSCSNIRPAQDSVRDQLELAKEQVKALKTSLDIEQYERKIDFQNFSKIVQNYKHIK